MRRAPRRERCRKALSEGGKQTQPHKHWFVESEVISNRAGQLRAPRPVRKEPGGVWGPFQLSLALKLFHWKICSTHQSCLCQGRQRGTSEVMSAARTGPGVPFAFRGEGKKGRSRVSGGGVHPQ